MHGGKRGAGRSCTWRRLGDGGAPCHLHAEAANCPRACRPNPRPQEPQRSFTCILPRSPQIRARPAGGAACQRPAAGAGAETYTRGGRRARQRWLGEGLSQASPADRLLIYSFDSAEAAQTCAADASSPCSCAAGPYTVDPSVGPCHPAPPNLQQAPPGFPPARPNQRRPRSSASQRLALPRQCPCCGRLCLQGGRGASQYFRMCMRCLVNAACWSSDFTRRRLHISRSACCVLRSRSVTPPNVSKSQCLPASLSPTLSSPSPAAAYDGASPTLMPPPPPPPPTEVARLPVAPPAMPPAPSTPAPAPPRPPCPPPPPASFPANPSPSVDMAAPALRCDLRLGCGSCSAGE